MRIIMVWEHATASDQQVPDTRVLALVSDPRVVQFWDPDRLTSRTMVRELPHDLAYAMADTTGGAPPLVWDIAMVYGPKARWGDRFPVPSFFATPVPDSIDGFRAALARALLGKE
ncbi:MAG TPA: hypothetical protein VLV15_05790 [Dongiaceae bacterium]|nr:hypothetical protein [Dongiaceae bacterium]